MAMLAAKYLTDCLQEWLGVPATSEQKIVNLVEAGLPTEVFDRLVERGLSKNEVSRVVINQRTLKRRRAMKQPLSQAESERVIRAVRVISSARAVFGDQNKALRWLRTPKKRLGGRVPIDMLSTEPGGRLVEQMLGQIDEGMFS